MSWTSTGCSLAELVGDPLIGLVMKSDGVERSELERLLQRVARERLQAKGLANPRRPRLLTNGDRVVLTLLMVAGAMGVVSATTALWMQGRRMLHRRIFALSGQFRRNCDPVFPGRLGGGRDRGNCAAFADLGLRRSAGFAVCAPSVSRVASLAGDGSAVTTGRRAPSNIRLPRDEALAALPLVRDIRAVPALFLIVFIDLVGFGLVIPLLPFYAVRFAASPQQVTALARHLFADAALDRTALGQAQRSRRTASGADGQHGRLGPCLFVARRRDGAVDAVRGARFRRRLRRQHRCGPGLCRGRDGTGGAGARDGPDRRGLRVGLHHRPGARRLARRHKIRRPPTSRRRPGSPSGLSLLALLGVIFMLPESLPAERRGVAATRSRVGAVRDVLRRPVLSRLILIFFLVILAFAGMQSIFAIWAMPQFGWGPRQVGYVFAYVGAALGDPAGRADRPFGAALWRGATAAVRSCFDPGGLLAMPFARDLPILAAAVTALALGMGLTQPSINSLISRRAGRGGARRGDGGLAIGRQPCRACSARSSPGSFLPSFGRNSPYFLAAAAGRASPCWWRSSCRAAPPRPRLAETGPLGREGGPAR